MPRPQGGEGAGREVFDTVAVRGYTRRSVRRPRARRGGRVILVLFLLAVVAAAVVLADRNGIISGLFKGFNIHLTGSVNTIDPNYPLVTVGYPSWDYSKEASFDFDGDGTDERLVVIARAERIGTGRDDYAWDDGQPWQVYVAEPEGKITHIYSRWVQIGGLSVYVDDGRIYIVENAGAGFTVYKVTYSGPGKYRVEVQSSFGKDISL